MAERGQQPKPDTEEEHDTSVEEVIGPMRKCSLNEEESMNSEGIVDIEVDEESDNIGTDQESDDIGTDEDIVADEESIRKKAADLGYSEPLTDAYILNDVKQLEKDLSLGSFFKPSSRSPGVESYAYCLVDSTSYKSFEKEDFRAFIKSVRYLGKGTGKRCCEHPFEKLSDPFTWDHKKSEIENRKKFEIENRKKFEIENIWKKGGKLTAVCLSYFSDDGAKQLEGLMMAAFGQRHFHDGDFFFCQLWNSTLQLQYKGTPLKDHSRIKRERKGVQLLYAAWKVYVDKSVVLEMMLSHPYAEAIRANDKKWMLQRAVQDFYPAGIEHLSVAEKDYKAAEEKYQTAVTQFQCEKKKHEAAEAALATEKEKSVDRLKAQTVNSEKEKEDLKKAQLEFETTRCDRLSAKWNVSRCKECRNTAKEIRDEVKTDLAAVQQMIGAKLGPT